MKKIDPRYYPPLFITLVLLVGQFAYGILESAPKTLLAIAAAMGSEFILSRLAKRPVASYASSYITGISVGILVRSPAFFPFILDSVASIASKYALTYKGRHIWNPSNFGITMMLMLNAHEASVLSLQWGNALWPMLVIWTFGIFVLHQSGRLHVTAAYVPSFLAFAWLRALIQDIPFSAAAAPITGPMYQLFIFFMITDPKVQVRSKKGQALVAVLVAAAEFGFRLGEAIYAPLYALFVVGPAALWWDRWTEGRGKAA